MADKKLQSLLDKTKAPLENVDLTVQIFGMYKLPDSWAADDTLLADSFLSAELLGMTFPHGKFIKRELTEEEKKAAEEAKSKKGPDKKGQEPTPEELEAREQERLAKEEKERLIQEAWDALDPKEQYERTYEDTFKHPFILWDADRYDEAYPDDEDTEDERGLKKFKTARSVLSKTGDPLVELQEFVEDAGGAYIRISKVANEESDRKKAPKKVVDDTKPIVGRGWVDLSDLQFAGVTETFVRVKLEDEEPDLEEGETYEPLYTNDTYVYLRVRVNPPVTPEVLDEPAVTPRSVLPTVRDLPSYKENYEISKQFRVQISSAAKLISDEYSDMFSD